VTVVGQPRKSGQTREHVVLARSLGVSQLVVAVNKLDCAEPVWSKRRFDEIRNRLVPFLKIAGFEMRRVTFVPISGLMGVNVKERVNADGDNANGNNAKLAEWYKGPSLLEAIDNFQPAKRHIDKPIRFIITDMYPEGKGVTTRGRMVQGMVSVGDKVVVLPVGDVATVARVEHGATSFANLPPTGGEPNSAATDPERLKIALAGDAVDIFLTGVDVARINPGNILSDVEPSLRPTIQKKLRAQIAVMDPLSIPIIPGSKVQYHMHSLDIPATITKLISREEKNSSKINSKDNKAATILKPRILTGGVKAVVELKLDKRVCVEAYSDCRALGRFALRYGGDTIAVGVVEKVLGGGGKV